MLIFSFIFIYPFLLLGQLYFLLANVYTHKNKLHLTLKILNRKTQYKVKQIYPNHK